MKLYICIAAVLFLFTGCKTINDEDVIYVCCAAGISDAMQKVCDDFEQQSRYTIKTNYASSGTLARQISMGVPCDIFISANKQWADFVDTSCNYEAPERLLRNKLTFIELSSDKSIQTIDSSFDYKKLLNGKRLALGNPEHVPAGRYAVEAFHSVNIDILKYENIIFCKDVKSVLKLVEIGEADAGIVYYSDAVTSLKNLKVRIFPEDMHEAIIFMVVHKPDIHEKEKALLNFLIHDKNNQVWEKNGLVLVNE